MASETVEDPYGMAPQLPRTDAQDDDFCDYTPLPKPADAQLDGFFAKEHAQLLQFGGLRTYETRILQEVDAYTPRAALPTGLSGYLSDESSENEEDASGTSPSSGGGGDDDYSIDDEKGGGAPLFLTHKTPNAAPLPWMGRDFVEVDETKWFKIFRRERWASYSHPDPTQLSVNIDDDKDWAKLSRAIEIANRVLNEALDQEWLATFLNPRARDARGPVSSGLNKQSQANTVIYRAAPVPPQARLSRKQAREALDDIADFFFWGFHMPDEFADATGKTSNMKNNGNWFHFMTLTLTNMEPLFRPKTRDDPEGRQTAVGTATVMLHELAHGLSSHFWDKTPKSKVLPCVTRELFFKEHRWAEAGYSFEKAVFGSTIKDHWISSDDRIQYVGMRGMTPETCAGSAYYRYDDWTPDDPFFDAPLGIPAIVPCAMATSDFWDVHVAKYGYPSLRWSWVCEGRSEIRDGETQVWPAKIMDQPYKYSRYNELNKSIKAVAHTLRERRLELKRLRPWYAGEYAFWSRTIYGETALRVALGNLAHSLYGHSLGHEDDTNGYIKRLLQPHSRVSDLEAARPEKTRTSKMFYHAMGFLGQAALPVRAGTVVYKTGTVAQYPDRLRPAMRPGFAGNAAMMDDLIAQGESYAKSRTTKTLYDNPRPSHDRELCMSNARLAFLRWRVLGLITHSTAKDFELEWQLLRRQLDQAPLDDRRLEWSAATWNFFRSYDGVSDHEAPAFFRPVEQMEQRSEGVDADIPAGAIARPAISIPAALARPPPAAVGAPWIPYYDPGEVGDHTRLYSSTKWGCVWDGREMAVYDITDLLVDGSWSRASRALVTRPSISPMCREVHTGRVGLAWRARFQTERPIGYVAAGRSREDVRINDGKEGRSRWVMVGEDVYDVTNIELPLELQDLEAIIAGASSDQDTIADAVKRGYHPDVICAALRPYRIGWVKNDAERCKRKHHVFTDNEVKWHTTRETGIYLIIRGKVYDFTKFIDQHPGGSSIIEQVAGTDATSVWDTFHGTPLTEYGFDVHVQLMNLEIGTVVQERFEACTPLAPTEIRIRNLIFSKDRLDPSNGTFDQLDRYWGSDGTADMEKLNPPEPYLQLWENPGLVVAKVRTPLDKLPYMSPKILEKMDGKAMPSGFNESYVSNGRYVYNLTSLLRYIRPSPFLDRLKQRAGTVLNSMVAADRELDQWLFATCSHRIIGLLRAPKHGHNSEEKPAAWKTSYRRAPGDTPKAVPQAGGSAATPTTPAPVPQPYTVRPLYPLRKKRRKTSNDGAEGLYPNSIEAWLSGAAMAEPLGEPMDVSMDNPVDDSVGDPMDLSRTVARIALDEMGFPV